MIDPASITHAELVDLCRRLDNEAQALHEALVVALWELKREGFYRAVPREPAVMLKPKTEPL